MYKYFEYDLVKNQVELDAYYNRSGLQQHDSVQEVKSSLKIQRFQDFTTFNATDVVLDYGCGTGATLHHLKKIISKGIGVDISATTIESAQKGDNLEFNVIKPGKPLSFKNNTFDKVLLLDVLEHVLNPEAVISECVRILKSNGKVLIEVPFTGFLSELFAGKFHEGHLRYYDPHFFMDWAKKQGLVVNSMILRNSVPLNKYVFKSMLLFNVMDKVCNVIPPLYYPWFGVIDAVFELS